MKRKSILAAAGFGGTVAAAALLGARFNPAPGTATGRWYERQRKSPLNPPPAVFAPVWTTLYTAMTVAAYRVWRAPESRSREAALRWWFAQLGLNAAWSPLFFGLKQPEVSLVDLLALLAAQSAFVRKANDVDRPAALLFVPYLAWVLFAGYLNAEIVRRNR
ncbi:MAG: tryptophan-rich sensory protein [Acidobacteria bacterium]|nr:tryptophan-rich sensory protein [Acidobacteriota bacterium]MBV9474671.1 tryptophan-rich sensory protein [Acidobacteriota bacterium]